MTTEELVRLPLELECIGVDEKQCMLRNETRFTNDAIPCKITFTAINLQSAI